MRNSRIDGNTSKLTNTFPHPYPIQDGATNQANAIGGGVFLSDNSSASLIDTTPDHNAVSVTSVQGDPFGGDAALCACGNVPLVLRHVEVAHNRLTVTVRSSVDTGPSGGIIEADGDAVISHTHVVDNVTRITATAGDAQGLATMLFFNFVDSQVPTVSHSVVSGNVVSVSAPAGKATLQGAAILNDGAMVLRHDIVSDNVGRVRGLTGFAQGGGI